MKAGLIFCLAAVLPLLAAAEAESPFRWTLERRGGAVSATVRVAEKFYLYAAEVRLSGTADGKPLVWTAPAPVEHDGEKIYPAGRWTWRAEGVPPMAALNVTAAFQGCSEAGLCRMPEKITLSGTSQAASSASGATAAPGFRVVRKLEGLADAPRFLAFLRGGDPVADEPPHSSWLWMIFLALAGGFALNFTPCVLPLIPVNLAIIGAAGRGWRTGLLRASVYGAGMTASYGALGAVVVLTGARFGMLNSSAWFNFAIAGVFLALSLAMFGAFDLDFSGLSGKIPLSGKPSQRGLWLVFVLGAVAALLAGACVAPVLIAVVVFAARTYADGDPAGLLLPFVLGLGMALPWPAAGAGLAFLPKPGAWMNHVKRVLGILILLAAVYYAYLGASLLPGKYDPDAELAKVRTALVTGRPVLIDFWASWCKNCRAMDRSTLRDDRVKAALRDVEFVKFQAEKLSDPAVKAMLDRCGVTGLPAFVLIEGKAKP